MGDLAHAAENDTDLHGDPDAMHWVERFVHHARPSHSDFAPAEVTPLCLDEGAMLAWFAGAIETGRMVERAKILAELGTDHFVSFTDEGGTWFLEHSAACRLSGAMATGECEYHQAVAAMHFPPERGRWRIAGFMDGTPLLHTT